MAEADSKMDESINFLREVPIDSNTIMYPFVFEF
jgi:hypothetical protein